MRKLTVLAAAIALASGCAMGPDYRAQAPELPEQWPGESPQTQTTQDWQQWWTRFEDPTLNQLVSRSLDDNLSLRVQIERIEQARAELGLSKANRWPSLSAQADATRALTSAEVAPAVQGGGQIGNQFSVAGVLSYELDLWGRLAREKEAAAARLAQTIYGTEAVRLNLITEVVTTYFNLRAAEQQLQITRDTIASREQTLELEQLRYDSGASDPLNIRQARAELETTRAQLPLQVQQVHELRSALAVLAGYEPRALIGALNFGDGKLSDIALPDSLPTVLPSELLQRRPDIRASEANLKAATAQVGVAQAQRFPSLNLTALGGSAALDASDLFTAPAEMWSVGANLAGPLFDFGRTGARVDSAESQLAQAQSNYQLSVISAFKETRDALTLYRTADQRVAAVRRQTQAIQETLELAQLQYDAGRIGFYELLDAQRGLLNAQLALSQALSNRLTASATLFKTMGGGWNHSL
ncbi:efflux transporter outer membrane subunit [Marinimicrobium agarilyticum]|uniref:efflux transporter outer membrane subunit n=1 Tax=Marinimicrobium agarilyticum TaxID=306546 RepID=UPI0004180928|nr:efflux transporter outer membrane subunit [Marinimicrobium agarilyticum]